MSDREDVRDLIENWAIWRDAGDWERFRSVWAPDGQMMATWVQGTAQEFIEASKAGWERGVSILHFLGGSSVEIRGERAVAQTKMTIAQRDTVEGVLCDVVCTGRFYDFLAKLDGRWKLVLRQPIYERDRIDPVRSGEIVHLDDALLGSFPVGYRHLAYLQTRIGYSVKPDMPAISGPATDALYARGDAWLTGTPASP